MKANQESKVRYAVIGAGHIAQVAVLPAFAHAKENSELVALVSGDAEKREELREKYDLQLVGDYSELEDIVARGRIDAVYIATPNASHRELTLRAADAGAHVLCEKPLATSAADGEIMAAACQQRGVKLMVAYRLHFDEATLKALELIANGRIGQARFFESAFSHVVKPSDIRSDPDEGGGATLDLGVYCINAARHVFQAEPVSVFATAVVRNGTDESMAAILRFSGERVAQFTISNGCASVSSYRVLGTEGDLRLEPAYEYAEGLEHYLTLDGKTRHESFRKRDQFAPELVHFSDCILNGRGPGPSAEEGICDLRVIDAIRESAATGRVVELPPRRHAYHPTTQQVMKKPAVGQPKTVKAASPSVK